MNNTVIDAFGTRRDRVHATRTQTQTQTQTFFSYIGESHLFSRLMAGA